jgi:hypothetical protein
VFQRLYAWWARRKFGPRLVFLYPDGTKTWWGSFRLRGADPWKVYRDITANPELDVLSVLNTAANDLSGHQDRVDQHAKIERVIKLVVDSFGVERYNPKTTRGLTDYDILLLVKEFLVYTADVKKNISLGLTLQGPTDSSASNGPVPPAPDTKPPSPSGSLPTEPSTAGSTT